MKNSHPDKILRILDANFNRAKEGLRVCEDICRYVWDDRTLTLRYKQLRHDLTKAAQSLNLLKALEARHIQGDVGRSTLKTEAQRPNMNAVFWANAQRVKESLRVLEEIAKLVNRKTAQQIKQMRYQAYGLEQKALKRR